MKKLQFYTVISQEGQFEVDGFSTVKAVVNFVAMVSVTGWTLEDFGRIDGWRGESKRLAESVGRALVRFWFEDRTRSEWPRAASTILV